EKIVTVSNGIYTEAFDPNADGTPIRKRYNIPSEAVVIGFVGSFQPYHRVDLLLEAFARLRQTRQGTHLLLIGSGKRFTKAQNQAERLGLLSDVTFTGQLPYEDVGAHTAAADITIMPATNTYGNPMKIYEYMAMGKAVIAPDQETITEIVTHGENAYLFAPEDIDSMAAALSAVIDDDALRHKLQHAALASSADHTWDERAKVMEDALHRATRR
ncbi:MAG: glycosyltransferase family 4 protein, partial [Chloroflexi bacterium]|nr:glycosyltransferase family 4 protein [Chloroflexota bacterium]